MRHLIPVTLFVLFLVTLLRADESRIPIWASPGGIASTITISKPGSYILTSDITSTASPVIQITSDNVTIDLNGRTITNNGSGAGFFFETTGITILNGRIKGGQYGIDRFPVGSGTLTVENVQIEDTNLQAIMAAAMSTITVRSCRMVNTNINGSTSGALFVNGANLSGHVVNNEIISTKGTGLYLFSLESGEVKDNVISQFNTGGQSGSSGIYVGGTNLVIENNTVQSASAIPVGITLTGKGNLVSHNNITGCSIGIFVIAKSQFIRENVIQGNGTGVAFGVSGAINSMVDANEIEGNTACGLDVNSGSANVARNNMLKGNGTAICGSNYIDAGGNIQ